MKSGFHKLCIFICICLHRLLFMSLIILESALLCRRRVGWRKKLARIQERKVQFLSQSYWENLNKSLPLFCLLFYEIQVMILNSFLRYPERKREKHAIARYIFILLKTLLTIFQQDTPMWRHKRKNKTGNFRTFCLIRMYRKEKKVYCRLPRW